MSDREILRIIGRNVAAARAVANVTQECLAEMVGVHWKTIGSIERGRYPFAVTTLIRISQHLQTSPNRLFEGVPEPDAKRASRIRKALERKRSARSG